MQYKIVLFLITIFLFNASQANQCKRLALGQANWTDVRATTAIAELLLESLGYRVTINETKVPDIYNDLSQGKLDAFLGTWMPADTDLLTPYLENNQIHLASINLTGAKYTLAVPKYAYDAGVKTFSDLAKHKNDFGGYIYGLEPDNPGNQLIKKMIDNNAYGLGHYRIVPTTEQIMLLQLKKKTQKGKWIVFLGWEPHPMNSEFDIAYLDGDPDYFGPDFGGATVHTSFRTGFREDCPNAARLLTNLKFTIEMENALMTQIDRQNIPVKVAAQNWIDTHKGQVNVWLSNIEPLYDEVVTGG